MMAYFGRPDAHDNNAVLCMRAGRLSRQFRGSSSTPHFQNYPRESASIQVQSPDAREIHNWFTEGFDPADLKEAKALLDELTVD
jgi:hypothetical protein